MKELTGLREEPKSLPFSFFSFCYLFFSFFFYHVLCINNLRGQRLRAVLAIVKTEPQPLLKPTGAREKAINPSLSGMRPTVHQPHKIGNQTQTKRAEQENEINTSEGINRNTLAVETI